MTSSVEESNSNLINRIFEALSKDENPDETQVETVKHVANSIGEYVQNNEPNPMGLLEHVMGSLLQNADPLTKNKFTSMFQLIQDLSDKRMSLPDCMKELSNISGVPESEFVNQTEEVATVIGEYMSQKGVNVTDTFKSTFNELRQSKEL